MAESNDTPKSFEPIECVIIDSAEALSSNWFKTHQHVLFVDIEYDEVMEPDTLQISDFTKLLLIDLKNIGPEPISFIRAHLTNPQTILVFQDCRRDYYALSKSLQIHLPNIFDIQIADLLLRLSCGVRCDFLHGLDKIANGTVAKKRPYRPHYDITPYTTARAEMKNIWKPTLPSASFPSSSSAEPPPPLVVWSQRPIPSSLLRYTACEATTLILIYQFIVQTIGEHPSPYPIFNEILAASSRHASYFLKCPEMMEKGAALSLARASLIDVDAMRRIFPRFVDKNIPRATDEQTDILRPSSSSSADKKGKHHFAHHNKSSNSGSSGWKKVDALSQWMESQDSDALLSMIMQESSRTKANHNHQADSISLSEFNRQIAELVVDKKKVNVPASASSSSSPSSISTPEPSSSIQEIIKVECQKIWRAGRFAITNRSAIQSLAKEKERDDLYHKLTVDLLFAKR